VHQSPLRALIPALLCLLCSALLRPAALAAAEGEASDQHPPAPTASPTGDAPPVVPATAAADPAAGNHLVPAMTTVNAGRGGSFSLADKDPSTLLGGVEILYEKVRTLCDHVSYWQSPLPGTAHAQLSRVLFVAGAEAADPLHVIFDTRATQLPMIGFRGLMSPTGVEVVRQPLDPAHPTLVSFMVKMHDMEDFAGDIQTSTGWKPHAGWADEMEAVVVATIVPAGLIKQRFTSLVLHGRSATEDRPRRRARLERLKDPIPPKAALASLHAKSMDWWVESKTITIFFDDVGKAREVVYDQDFHGEGTPSLDSPVDRHSQPALDPKH